MKKLKEIPKFKSEDHEREFWMNHDSTEYIDWNSANFVSFPNLKPTMKTVSLQLPEFIVEELRIMARKRDVSYQALIKIFIKERIDQELNRQPLPKQVSIISA